MGMSLGFLDETLPNSINEKTPIQNQKGRNNKKRPMSNQGITPKKMSPYKQELQKMIMEAY
jgi:hypothetical protein